MQTLHRPAVRWSLALIALVGVGLAAVVPPTFGEDAPTANAKTKEPAKQAEASSVGLSRKPFPGERYFKTVTQLTDGGENAEAYWSFDEKRLIFQSTRGKLTADQIFTMDADGKNVKMVSTGHGRTTCAYYLPGDKRIVYASTHLGGKAPPKKPAHDRSLGYVWPIFHTYDIFTALPDGSDVKRLTDSPKYDAEATVSPTGHRMVFTSARDGDLDVYTMKLDGSDVQRVTNAPGYDGGAFYSWDGKKIVWRAPSRDGFDAKEFKTLLERQLVRPSRLEIWIADEDGGNKKMLTNNGAANFGPFWHPDGKRIIFSSNMHDPKSGNFELYLVHVDTRKTERVTYFTRKREGARRSDDFDGFPMFTRDGKKLVFCSNRFNKKPNETNVFVVDWAEPTE